MSVGAKKTELKLLPLSNTMGGGNQSSGLVYLQDNVCKLDEFFLIINTQSAIELFCFFNVFM